MSSTFKTISAESAAYEGFRQLAKEHQLTNPELLAAMVQYFRVTKVDPQQPKGPDLTSSLAQLSEKLDKLDKRTIGFIREQEKQYLKPILAQVQAQQAVNAPAPSASAGLSEAQGQELIRWFIRVMARGIQPAQLTPKFQADSAQISGQPGAADPTLTLVKQTLAAVLQQALRPELLTPALLPKPAPSVPAGPAGTPVSFPPQPA